MGGFIEDPPELRVDLAGGLLAVRPGCFRPDGAWQKSWAVLLLKTNSAKPAHAELGDHAASQLRAALQIVGRARGDFLVNQFLSHGAAQEHLDTALQFGLRR